MEEADSGANLDESGPSNLVDEYGPSNPTQKSRSSKDKSGSSNLIGESPNQSGAGRNKQRLVWMKDFVCEEMKLVI